MQIINKRNIRGFTLIEMLVVISIMGFLFAISMTVFSSITKNQGVDKDVETAHAFLLRAKNQTLNAQYGSQYGVHFASTSVTLFEGTVYNASSTTNQVFDFQNRTTLNTISLNGGVVDVYFKKITAMPSATGTIQYRSTTDSSITKTMIIYGSGLVDVQW